MSPQSHVSPFFGVEIFVVVVVVIPYVATIIY